MIVVNPPTPYTGEVGRKSSKMLELDAKCPHLSEALGKPEAPADLLHAHTTLDGDRCVLQQHLTTIKGVTGQFSTMGQAFLTLA